MHRIRTALFFTAIALTACQTLPSPRADKAQAEAAIAQWAAAFNSCDSEKAASLYGVDAVLWGTVSSAIIASPAGIRQYFERVCASSPQPKVALGESLVRVHGETALNSGSYTFTVFPGGQARQFPARYSFTYRNVGGAWLIVDHHSSAAPAPAPAAAAPAR
jgi:uncharacterized protein (TIGR02246 family)